jgi:uncharacterized protein (DUF1330 family)
LLRLRAGKGETSAHKCIRIFLARLRAACRRRPDRSDNNKENTMNRSIALGLAMLAGGAIGATAVSALQAQGKAPGAYAVVDISAITNPDVFKTVIAKAGPAMQETGGHYIARTEKITNIDGVPPARFVIIAFDSVAQAQAWDKSAPQQEVDSLRKQSTTSRAFIVEGMAN